MDVELDGNYSYIFQHTSFLFQRVILPALIVLSGKTCFCGFFLSHATFPVLWIHLCFLTSCQIPVDEVNQGKMSSCTLGESNELIVISVS
uniref:Uncharacterized protein n=1 Tax=Anguilla anguilla TaxID=7936 RepID=A0A0E9VEP6_ANGAN